MLEKINEALARFNVWKKNEKTLKKRQIVEKLDLIKALIEKGHSLKSIFKFLQNDGLNCSYDFFRVCVNELVFSKKKIYPKKSKIDEENFFNRISKDMLVEPDWSHLRIIVRIRNLWRQNNPNISHKEIGNIQLKKLLTIANRILFSLSKESEPIPFNEFKKKWNNGEL